MATGKVGTLRVELVAVTDAFKRNVDGARKSLRNVEQDIQRFRRNNLAGAVSLGILGGALKSSMDVASQYDNAARQLGATAKLTGVELSRLEGISSSAREQFKLSGISANAFTIELTKLAGKAGDLGKASAGLEAFLDIGAARGLSADQTLKAVQQSILGIDEGADKLFSKNPSVLYKEFADSIGTTAGKLTDGQKAQALLTAAMRDGDKVRGEYSKWLETSQGQQYLLSQNIEQTQAALGKALQPALVATIPLLRDMADAVTLAVKGYQLLGVEGAVAVETINASFSSAKNWMTALRAQIGLAAKMRGIDLGSVFDVDADDFDTAALDRIRNIREAAAEMRREIMGDGPTPSPQTLPVSLGGGDPKADGKSTAKQWFSGLEEEWEALRHSVESRKLDLGGDRLKLEETHALKLLAIQEQHAKARHALGELSDHELAATMRQLSTRREIATATRAQLTEVTAHIERQAAADELHQVRLDHEVQKIRLLARTDDERLAAARQVYDIRLRALEATAGLSNAELEVEREKLRLAREREEIQLKQVATVREEASALEGMAQTVAGMIVPGGNGASLGSSAGGALAKHLDLTGIVASTLLPGIGGFIGAGVGSLLGGLFSKDDEKANPVVTQLKAIERAQRENITAIQTQTNELLNPQQRMMNLPSSYTVPSYRPSGVSTTTVYETSVTVNVAEGMSRDEAESMVASAMNKALYNGNRDRSRNRSR